MDFKKHCKTCDKNTHCCIFKKGGFTFITPKDAERISRTINKEYSYFLDNSPLPKKVVSELKKSDPALEGAARYLQLDKENRISRLKVKKDYRCIFLDDDCRCEIYDIRPNVCKIFPFWGIRLTDGKIKIIKHSANHRCKMIKSLAKQDADIEKAIPKDEKRRLTRIFKDIEKEI